MQQWVESETWTTFQEGGSKQRGKGEERSDQGTVSCSKSNLTERILSKRDWWVYFSLRGSNHRERHDKIKEISSTVLNLIETIKK